MSKDNRDRLDIEINRYLDGEISDSEFEAFLGERPEGFDIESFRKLKTRVEKIEEVYRQIEEPEVPEGYWDAFADRVDEKIGATEKTPVWERFLNIILPTRWPKVAYRYIGAVASVVLVFAIGRSILESGADKYQPSSKPAPAMQQEPKRSAPRIKGEAEEEWQRNEVIQSSEETTEYADMAAQETTGPKESSTTGEGTKDIEKQPVNQPKPIGKGSGAVADEQHESAPEVQMELNNLRLSTNEYDAYDKAATRPKASLVPEDLQMPTPSKEQETPSIITKEPVPIPPVDPGEEGLYEMFKMTTDRGKDAGESSVLESKMLSPTGSVNRMGDNTRVWKYDNWDLKTLRDRIKLYQRILSDSSYSSEAFSDYAEMRSSVAVLTRDSIDIYDAVNAIDTVLNYNKRIDKNSWMIRREQIRSLRNSKINR